MKKVPQIILLLLVLHNYTVAQQSTIDVADLTLKIGTNSTEEFYYGFEEGDKIVFSFEENNGKELKEVEIIEYPKTVKFSDYETSKIENKTLAVNKKSVYKFRFKNKHKLKGRVCKVKIQRIPGTEATANFDTSIKWVTEQDTTWNIYTKKVVVGHDTIYTKKTKKVLASKEIVEEMIFNKAEEVAAFTSINSTKKAIPVTLPQSVKSKYESKKIVSWFYWVCVKKESNQAWAKNKKAIVNIAKFGGAIYSGGTAGAAAGAATDIVLPEGKETISYALTDYKNAQLFLANQKYAAIDYGTGTANYFIVKDRPQGTYYVLLYNDNFMTKVHVDVKVMALVEHKIYKDEEYTDMDIKPVYEEKIMKEPKINTRKFAVTSDYKGK